MGFCGKGGFDMSYIADFHTHSSFSDDSNETMENVIQAAIKLGMPEIAITEHMDIGYPETPDMGAGVFNLNTDSYLYDLIKNKEKFKDQINVLFGVEIGLQQQYMREIAVYAKSYDFDYIIGSMHVLPEGDPYYPEFFSGRTDEEVYQEYLQETLACVKRFHNFDVLGHMTYIIRYGMEKDKNFSYSKYKTVIDKILEVLVDNGNGIELNTASLRKGLAEITPGIEILKKYVELGGEVVTVGSDAHVASEVGADFEIARQMMLDAGLKYYATFEKRSVRYNKL